MTRLILERLLIFAVPFAFYEIYRWLRQGEGRRPWAGLFIGGLVLVIASFLYVGLTEGDSPKGRYVPPHVENGRVIPGHVEQEKAP